MSPGDRAALQLDRDRFLGRDKPERPDPWQSGEGHIEPDFEERQYDDLEKYKKRLQNQREYQRRVAKGYLDILRQSRLEKRIKAMAKKKAPSK